MLTIVKDNIGNQLAELKPKNIKIALKFYLYNN